MPKLKKIIFRCLLIFVIIIPVAAFAHFVIFPQETRCILIDCSDFKKQGRLYFNKNTAMHRMDTLQILIAAASLRVKDFWGEKKADPKFIFCDSDADFKKYGNINDVPAVTQYKLGPYIVIGNEGADLDIIAHELSHAELCERLGFFKMMFTIPRWFDEGLAMQNDYRDYYSDDTLKAKSDNFKNLPDLQKFNSGSGFYEGTREQVMLNYMAAKHAVKNWYTRQKLNQLIGDIKAGKSFTEAYR
jgi:hypothetical protein